MKITNRRAILLGLAFSLAAAQPAVAENIAWTDWTSATPGTVGSADGAISQSGQSFLLSYSGEINFAQLGTGINYWTEPNGSSRPYTGNDTVDNPPTASELIATNLSGERKIVFDPPVENPILAILSMGRTNAPVTYAFKQPFTVLGEGQGYWGDGTFEVSGNSLSGKELHGVIQFKGTVSTITWDSSPDEFWHGFTVGLPAQTLDVDINVHPNSDPNPLNLGSGGAVPVAIFGSPDFDVTEINLESLRFSGASVKVAGKSDRALCSFEDIGSYDVTMFDSLNPMPDYEIDIVCHFYTFQLTDLALGEELPVELNGELNDGTSFVGSDVVKVVKE